MTRIDAEELVSVMRRLALEAGEIIMRIYDADDFEVRAKSDDSPVTEADIAADRHISDGLRDAFPDILLVTEEQDMTHNRSAECFLIVDPLDGTKEFVKRRGDFTVNIAYVENGMPTRGVVYAPARQRLFFTDADGVSYEEIGAFSPLKPGQKQPISVSAPHDEGLSVVASKSHRDAATDAYIAEYKTGALVSAGSSLKFCLVATGEADLYPRLGRTMEWDTAAGQAVLTGAGGKVVRLSDGEPLLYGKPGFENPFFLAYAPWVEVKKA